MYPPYLAGIEYSSQHIVINSHRGYYGIREISLQDIGTNFAKEKDYEEEKEYNF